MPGKPAGTALRRLQRGWRTFGGLLSASATTLWRVSERFPDLFLGGIRRGGHGTWMGWPGWRLRRSARVGRDRAGGGLVVRAGAGSSLPRSLILIFSWRLIPWGASPCWLRSGGGLLGDDSFAGFAPAGLREGARKGRPGGLLPCGSRCRCRHIDRFSYLHRAQPRSASATPHNAG